MHAPGYRGQFKTGRVDGGQFWMNGVAKVEKSTASTAEGLGHKAWERQFFPTAVLGCFAEASAWPSGTLGTGQDTCQEGALPSCIHSTQMTADIASFTTITTTTTTTTETATEHSHSHDRPPTPPSQMHNTHSLLESMAVVYYEWPKQTLEQLNQCACILLSKC